MAQSVEELMKLIENEDMQKELESVITSYAEKLLQQQKRPVDKRDAINVVLISFGLKGIITRDCKCSICAKRPKVANLIEHSETCLQLVENLVTEVTTKELNKLS